MKKPSIPQLPGPNDNRQGFDRSIKETLEIITGRRGHAIGLLPSSASTAEIVAKLNEIIGRLQD